MCQGDEFPHVSEALVTQYLCSVGDSSPRPKSVLNATVAAISCLYDAMGLDNPTSGGYVSKLVNGIIKSGTHVPMTKTPVMPIEPFYVLFQEWPDNDLLSVKDLRLKTICLMALSFMLRPSDIAPRGQSFVPQDLSSTNMTFSAEQVCFHDNGDVSVTFHAIKNDSLRDGFKVTLSKCSDNKLDVASALRCYMSRTDALRRSIPSCPVFISLQRPFHALGASAISKVLQDAIVAAGLEGKGYSAKCFRPTGATQAISKGVQPEIARHIGRWASQEVFDKHYVHTKVPSDYLDNILC